MRTSIKVFAKAARAAFGLRHAEQPFERPARLFEQLRLLRMFVTGRVWFCDTTAVLPNSGVGRLNLAIPLLHIKTDRPQSRKPTAHGPQYRLRCGSRQAASRNSVINWKSQSTGLSGAALALLWHFRLGCKEHVTVRTLSGWRSCEEVEDRLPDGRHAWLWWRS